MTGFLHTKLFSPTLPILIRNPEPTDAAALSRILSNPANIGLDKSANALSVSDAEVAISRMRESAAEAVPTRVNFVVELLSGTTAPKSGEEKDGEEEGDENGNGNGNGNVIGLSGFGGIDVDPADGKRFADVGAMIDPEYRGRGFALEAVRLSIDFAFGVLKVDGVTAHTLEANVAMVGLLDRKLGWKAEKKEEMAGADAGAGVVEVECVYRMSESEWRLMRERLV